MKFPRPFRSVALAIAFTLALVNAASAAALPRLEADSLGGTHVVLPSDAAGKPLVLLLAFTKESQEQVKSWSRKLLDDHVDANASVYVVVIADKTVFFGRSHVRKLVESASVGTQAQKDSHVLITFDGNGWRELVPPAEKHTAGVVVCDGAGNIVLAKRETYDDTNAAEVERAAR